MARPYKVSKQQTRQGILDKLIASRDRYNKDIELLVRWSILGEPCEASDSDKIVMTCWCPECKEIVHSIETKGVLPEWLR